jgi:fatty acid desaturase
LLVIFFLFLGWIIPLPLIVCFFLGCTFTCKQKMTVDDQRPVLPRQSTVNTMVASTTSPWILNIRRSNITFHVY